MNVTLSYSDFRHLITTACKLLECSEIGKEVVGSNSCVFWLEATQDTLSLSIAIKGIDLRVQVDLTECTEAGGIAINPFLLKRMSLKSPTVTLISDHSKLNIKAGRFKTDIAAINETKQNHYDPVELTHEIPSKQLVNSLVATALEGPKEGQPFSRIVWTDRGARVWTHNSYNAAYTMILDEEAEIKLDCILPVNMLRGVAESSPNQNIKIGVGSSVFRFQNSVVDVSHPMLTDMELEDIEAAVQDIDKDSIPLFGVDPAIFGEALQAVGSIDRDTAGTPQSGIDLWILPAKSLMVLSIKTSVGESSQKITLESHQNLGEEQQLRLNHKQLMNFVARAKGQKLQMGILPDRTIMWAGPATYVLAPVQEDAE